MVIKKMLNEVYDSVRLVLVSKQSNLVSIVEDITMVEQQTGKKSLI